MDFAETLEIPGNVVIETSFDGTFWYRVLRALNDLCEAERDGKVLDKRRAIQELLRTHIGKPKDNYKAADTGLFFSCPQRGRIHLRERVHIREGRPTETESIYWATVGDSRPTFRYLIGRIGRHA